MEDLSPDEVRWEMYQAQLNGTADQMKLQFQQLCQEMKVKRDALKNPTPEIISMLEKIQKGHQGGFGSGTNAAAKPSNFSFATPQLSLANNTTPTGTATTSNPFGSQFGSNANPFANSFAPAAATQGTSIFGRSGNTNPAFNAKPTFGSAPVFGNTTFGKFTPQSSVFGGVAVTNSTSLFGQTQAQSNSFLRPQSQPTNSNVFGTTTSSTVFSGATSPGGSIFGGAAPIQTSTTSMFAAKPATSSIFGGSTTTFGAASAPAAFGSAPVFGSTPTFAKPFSASPLPPPTTANSMFGGSPTFGATPFGTAQAFSTVGAPTTSAPIFANATPFGTFSKAPTFAKPNTYGNFGVNSTNTPDSGTNLAASLPANSPFHTNSTQSMNPVDSPFAPAYSTPTSSVVVNPFSQRTQTISSPFSQNPFTPAASQSPFSKPFSSASASIIDDNVYSDDNQLTDDEKRFYMAEQFELGKIPLKPPTKDLR
ncbi:nuclear pore complex protein DDB_G0274915 isoform X2 [Cephus cinctus]|nr:nuclear pore complex protein DDB_G0274915 isoform X2 [Cephus cinctus]